MFVIIRTDASTQIGTGHVMRCLTLASILGERGATVRFVCREQGGDLCDHIEAQGFSVSRLPGLKAILSPKKDSSDEARYRSHWKEDAERTRSIIDAMGVTPDWLVVDHYALDQRWESALRAPYGRIMVIDDLGDRPHDCDLLLDQNLHDDSEALYRSRVAPGTRCFFGPKYAILRREFDAPGLLRSRNGELRRLLVFFGGADSGNQCARVLEALRQLGESAPETTIVLGRTNPHHDVVLGAAKGMRRVAVLESTHRMSTLFAEADLGIGTCGVAAWERCALGLPAIVTITADNQRDDARILHGLGACLNLGEAHAVTAIDWAEAILHLGQRPQALRRMAAASFEVMRGRQQASIELEAALVGSGG